MTEKLTAIELLQKARQSQNIRVVFDLSTDPKIKIPAMLSSMDRFEILQIQAVEKKRLFVKYRKEGFDKEPIDDGEWNEHIEAMRKNLEDLGLSESEIDEKIKAEEDSKPSNMAEQLASEYANLSTIKEIIPKFLKDPETAEPLFKTAEERLKFQEIICDDMRLMNLVALKFSELQKMVNALGGQAKNFSGQENSENTNSETNSQDVTDSGSKTKESKKP